MKIDCQRLRTLTTRRLHTPAFQDCVDDIEKITGEDGLMTHQVPNALLALEDWLREKVTDQRFFDGKFDITHTGEYEIPFMTEEERTAFFARYEALPSIFEGK